MPKHVAILGSTGSVGQNALRVIDALNASCDSAEERYEVTALSAHCNVELLAKQFKRYRPRFVAVTDADSFEGFRKLTAGSDAGVLCGPAGLVEIAQLPDVDIVLAAVVGAAGLPAVLAAAAGGKRIAIANKEPLVIAGRLVTDLARKHHAEILPVDSEHSAIFQALQAGRHCEVSKVVLTTSGGPFRGASLGDIEVATLDQALAHPVWQMGPKITVDSATMMNKALEIIEARWLFDLPPEKIDVLVHPESIIHSLVEFVDGSVIAQLGQPDMRLPIQYALTWPKRLPGLAKRLKLEEIGTLTFEKPNLDVFRALALGFEVAKTADTTAAVFNAANEVAVSRFLEGAIKFTNIIELVERCLDRHTPAAGASLDELLDADRWARKEVAECLKQNIC